MLGGHGVTLKGCHTGTSRSWGSRTTKQAGLMKLLIVAAGIGASATSNLPMDNVALGWRHVTPGNRVVHNFKSTSVASHRYL